MFGMRESQINQYLSIYKLSQEITLSRKSNLDTQSLAGIGSEDDWSKSEKKEAIEILSKVEKSEERRNLLSEIKKKKSEDEDISIEQAHKEIIKSKETRNRTSAAEVITTRTITDSEGKPDKKTYFC